MRLKFYSNILILIFLAINLPIYASEDKSEHICPHSCKPGKFEMMHATGINYCVNCALKNELNAKVDCEKYGHLTALKITKYVSFCGEEKPEFVGKTYFYLDNEASKPLKSSHIGETVTVSGRLYFELPLIEAQEIKFHKTEDK